MKKLITFPFWIIVLGAAAYAVYARPPALPDRYILTADQIVTMDPTTPMARAVLVENGVIRALGADLADVQKLGDAKVFHYPGVLTPGLIEAHTHPIAAALLGASVDISSSKYDSRAEIMTALKEAASETALTPWLIAFGWDPVAMPGLFPPTRAELDKIAPDRPVLILTQMLHDAYVNTAAVEAAGITLRGSHLHETVAIDSVVSKLPAPAPAVTEILVRQQFARYAAGGFTTIGVTGAVGRHDDPMGLLRKISTDDHSALRTFGYLTERHLNQYTLGGDLDFAILGAKLWMDGSPFTGGAATREPYEINAFVNDHLNIPKGKRPPVLHPSQVLLDRIAPLHAQGYQIALHVQGERAVEVALDTFERLQSQTPMPGLHHRLEHNALITENQLARAADLGLTMGFFVDHIYYYGHVLPRFFGPERAARYMPIKSALDAELVVGLHGDHPATPINAVQTMRSATTRLARDGETITAPTQAISCTQALHAMTLGSAMQLGLGDDLGSISVGKQADFTLFSGDPTAGDLSQITVVGTWKSGQPADTRLVSWLKPGLVFAALKHAILGD